VDPNKYYYLPYITPNVNTSYYKYTIIGVVKSMIMIRKKELIGMIVVRLNSRLTQLVIPI
ncbi:MAG: hypothetical protein QGF45_02365, partial [SAR324 cluster bacterium]|nr:hypothetical protein [SAR324 cluster bacterium]